MMCQKLEFDFPGVENEISFLHLKLKMDDVRSSGSDSLSGYGDENQNEAIACGSTGFLVCCLPLTPRTLR